MTILEELESKNLSVEDLEKERFSSVKALETLNSDLSRIILLETYCKQNGASRTFMESLESLVPNVLPETTPTCTFTVDPSPVQFSVAIESIYKALQIKHQEVSVETEKLRALNALIENSKKVV